MVKLDNVVACRTSHKEPASPDKKTTDERDRRIRLRVVLHQVVVVDENQLLCLLIIQRVELSEVVAEDLDAIL